MRRGSRRDSCKQRRFDEVELGGRRGRPVAGDRRAGRASAPQTQSRGTSRLANASEGALKKATRAARPEDDAQDRSQRRGLDYHILASGCRRPAATRRRRGPGSGRMSRSVAHARGGAADCVVLAIPELVDPRGEGQGRTARAQHITVPAYCKWSCHGPASMAARYHSQRYRNVIEFRAMISRWGLTAPIHGCYQSSTGSLQTREKPC